MSDATGWQPLIRSRAWEQVVDRVEKKILSGELRIGDRLPPERDLAAMLGVSRAAVREALRVLEAHGVLRRPQVGTGRDSGSVIAGTPTTGLARLLRVHVALSNFDLDEITEARIALERASVSLAASHATEDDLARMHELLERMEDNTLSRDRFNDLDTDFHTALAEAADNRLLTALTTAIREAIRHTLLHAFERLTDADAVLNVLRHQHRSLHEAVAQGDATRAADEVDRHIRGFHRIASLTLGRSTPGTPPAG